MPTHQALANYLEEAFGEGTATLLGKRSARGLPAYMVRSYELLEGRIFGREALLALQQRETRGQTPKRLVADGEALLRAFPGTLVVLVLDAMPSYVRRRLIAAEVPFIVPGQQIFLPLMLINLRERLREQAVGEVRHVAWPAQVVLLRHLLHGDVEQQNLAGVAETCGYSAMAISNAQRQLVEVELASLRQVGRSKHLAFKGQGQELWRRGLPLLRRPWRKRHPVTVANERPPVWFAGADALSSETLLAADNVPAVAMSAPELRALIANGTFIACPAADDADLLVEAWEYDPARLATGNTVDPLSLYLSLREDPDERIQIALEQYMESFTW